MTAKSIHVRHRLSARSILNQTLEETFVMRLLYFPVMKAIATLYYSVDSYWRFRLDLACWSSMGVAQSKLFTGELYTEYVKTFAKITFFCHNLNKGLANLTF